MTHSPRPLYTLTMLSDGTLWRNGQNRLNGIATSRGRPAHFEVVPDQQNPWELEIVYDRLGRDKRRIIESMELSRLLDAGRKEELAALADWFL